MATPDGEKVKQNGANDIGGGIEQLTAVHYFQGLLNEENVVNPPQIPTIKAGTSLERARIVRVDPPQPLAHRSQMSR